LTHLTRSRSNGCDYTRAKRRGGFRQARRISIRRRGCSRAAGRRQAARDGGGRRRAAGELAGETQSRVPVHGLACGLHLSEAHDLAKLAGAVTTVVTRRHRRATRRRGSAEATKSGELLRAAQDFGSRTNDANILLTSKYISWMAPCQRGGGGDGKQRRRREARVRDSAAHEKQGRRLEWGALGAAVDFK
jgi:hypothetical protein